MEYPLDEESLKRYLERFKHLGKKAELVWMTPDEFLSKVPHPVTDRVPALYDLREKFFSKTSIGFLRKAMMERAKLSPLLLNYADMWFGWPGHEGRHRAFVSKMLEIQKVPVLVVK